MKTQLELSEETMRYVQSCLAGGKYESISALVETALREKSLHDSTSEEDFSIERARWEEYKRTGITVPFEELERWASSLPES